MSNNPSVNSEIVRTWMSSVGQQLPEDPTKISPVVDIMKLRQLLVAEEADEFNDVVDDILASYQVEALPNPMPQELISLLANALKEAADVLVVTYGFFSAIGIDADEAFRIVMAENSGKVAHGSANEHGKWVVPPEVKQRLKDETHNSLTNLVIKSVSNSHP